MHSKGKQPVVTTITTKENEDTLTDHTTPVVLVGIAVEGGGIYEHNTWPVYNLRLAVLISTRTSEFFEKAMNRFCSLT